MRLGLQQRHAAVRLGHPAVWQADVSLQQLQFQKGSSLPPCLTQKGLSTSILAAASQQDTTRGVLCCDQLSWRQQQKHTQSMAHNNVWLCLFNMSCGNTKEACRMLRGAEQFEKQVEDTRPHVQGKLLSCYRTKKLLTTRIALGCVSGTLDPMNRGVGQHVCFSIFLCNLVTIIRLRHWKGHLQGLSAKHQ